MCHCSDLIKEAKKVDCDSAKIKRIRPYLKGENPSKYQQAADQEEVPDSSGNQFVLKMDREKFRN